MDLKLVQNWCDYILSIPNLDNSNEWKCEDSVRVGVGCIQYGHIVGNHRADILDVLGNVHVRLRHRQYIIISQLDESKWNCVIGN